MSKLYNPAKISLLAIILSASLTAGERFLVQVSGDVTQLAHRHNLHVVKSLSGSGSGVHVLSTADGADPSHVLRNLKLDLQVRGVEQEKPLLLPGISSKTSPNPAASRLAPAVHLDGTPVF